MRHPIEYTPRERFWLVVLGAVGFVAINGAFLYGLLFRPDYLASTLGNPVGMAFVAEALVLVGVFAYLFERWRVSRIRWWWFVALSLIGSMAFAVPIALLYARREDADLPGNPDGSRVG